MIRNYMAREMIAKIVFSGPKGGGRKTALQRYFERSPREGKVQLDDDAHAAKMAGALSFQFMPEEPVRVGAFPVRLSFHVVGDPLYPGPSFTTKTDVAMWGGGGGGSGYALPGSENVMDERDGGQRRGLSGSERQPRKRRTHRRAPREALITRFSVPSSSSR